VYLLDTNVVSELRLGNRAHARVREWNATVALEACWIASVTLFELRLGALLKQRVDADQGAILLAWIARVRDSFEGRIVDVDLAGWERCADLHVPNPRPLRDSLLAACAANHGLTIVTRNARDFAGMGVAVIDPWRRPEKAS
jgi:hypothetical protein